MSDNFNSSNFVMQDMLGRKIPACAAFIYKGYIISMATTMRTPSVIVFVDGADVGEYTARSVEDAIEWVNKNGG